MQVALSNLELLAFSEIQDDGRRHLGFTSHLNLPHSVMLIVCCSSSIIYIKFGSNICYGHRDEHIYAPDVHLMTSRELTSGFDFWLRGHLCMAVVHLPI